MARLKGSKNKKTLLLEAGSLIKENDIIPIIKRGRGRPRKTIIPATEKPAEATGQQGIVSQPLIKRGRGRPRKNIMQTIEKDPKITGNKKEIILQIKRLKRLKLQCKAGNPERINLEHQIKELKKKLNIIQENITPEKQNLINKNFSNETKLHKRIKY